MRPPLRHKVTGARRYSWIGRGRAGQQAGAMLVSPATNVAPRLKRGRKKCCKLPIRCCKLPMCNARAVVDPELCVHGSAGLCVADAAIMPTVVSGNTNAATIMLGERVADLVREPLQLAA